jgi:hypothetical protein
MKRAFIRSLWGDVSNHRNGKIAKEISSVKEKDWFTVLTFGLDNHKWLKGMGFHSTLVSEEPVMFDLDTELYRHKLEIFDYAFLDYEEFAFLDWDCVPTGKLDGVWKELNKKESFQANLFQYRTKKCLWRETDHRKTCNGGFAYFRDPKIPSKMIGHWEDFRVWVMDQKQKRESVGKKLRFRETSLIFDDEPAMSKYIDEVSGGWPGADKYWDLFEPSVCNLRKKSVYSEEKLKSKGACLIHNL